MNSLTINDLLAKVAKYNNEEIEIMRKLYSYVEEIPERQRCQSEKRLCTHPLSVAYILVNMHADRNTILLKL